MSTIPDPQQIVTHPVLFFAHEPNTGINKSLFLTDIMVNEDIIIEVILMIHELSLNSAACPDCVPSSLLVNCATELAPVLLLIFYITLSHGVVPKSWKRAVIIIPIYKSGDKTVPSNSDKNELLEKKYFLSLTKRVVTAVLNMDLGLVVSVQQLCWMFLIILCTC